VTVTQKELQGYISAGAVAELFGVSRVRVHHLSEKGRLPFLVTPIGRLYPKKEIEAIAVTRPKREAKET
jgi:predicted site-specific integrase-resolvase